MPVLTDYSVCLMYKVYSGLIHSYNLENVVLLKGANLVLVCVLQPDILACFSAYQQGCEIFLLILTCFTSNFTCLSAQYFYCNLD